MRFTAMLEPERRERSLALLRKQYLHRLRRPCESRPVFIFGRQRFGTSMLINVFHRHPDALVYTERADNPGFKNFRIRDFQTIKSLLDASRFPEVCFKPICDSHRVNEFREAFPTAHHLWIYRNYEDVANSTLRKFQGPTREIRAVCTGQPGGAWLEEGLSVEVGNILKDVYSPELTEFDLACLFWWARNRLFFESNLAGCPDVTLLKYEALVSDPSGMLCAVADRIGLPYHEPLARYLSPRSIGRHPAPDMNDEVRDLCDTLMAELDNAFCTFDPRLPEDRAEPPGVESVR